MTFPVNNGPAHHAAWQTRLTWWGWLCCALSLAFIQAIPTIPAISFVCVVVLYSALFPLRSYRALLWNFVPWTIVVFGALSAIWSDHPMHSARAAAQIAITTLAAITFAQGLKAYSYIAIVMYALLASVAANLYVPGMFGAKNSLGLTIALLILSSCWVMLDNRQPRLARIVALVALLGTPPMLVAAGSEGALLAGALALLCSFVPLLLRPLPSNARIVLIWFGVLAVCIALGITFWLFGSDLLDLVLLSIDKDVSLTGRTLLWSHAVNIIADHPFGLGLQAFWVEGNREAERFWAFFYIYSRTGFHFHNLWLETGVELGLIGIVIAAGTTLVVFFSIVRWALRDPGPESCFFVGFVTFVVLRTFGEVELFIQFSLIPMIFLAGYYYADSARARFVWLMRRPAAGGESVAARS
jgi:exopolysaccharide production protein ExoQ